VAIINLNTQQASLKKTLVKSSVLASSAPKLTASKIKVSDTPKSKLGKQPFFKAPKIPKPLKVKPENLLSKLSKWDGTFTNRMHTMSFTSSAAKRRMAEESTSPKVDKPTSAPKADKPIVKSSPKVDKPASKPTQSAGDDIVKMINGLQKSFASLSSRVDVIMSVISRTSKTQQDQSQQLQNIQNNQIQSQTIQSQELKNLQNSQIQSQKEQNERFLGLQNSQIKIQRDNSIKIRRIQSNTSILRDTQETIINNQTQQNETITSLNETTGEIVNNQQQAQEADGDQSQSVDPVVITELQEKTNNIIQSQSEIKDSLEETTTILNDIGNAMSLDFADRIQKERKILQKERKKKLVNKRKEAEKSVETPKDLEKKGNPVVDKIKKPILSLMDRIKSMLTFLILGFISAPAIKWLRNNVGAIDSFFDFFKRHWMTILGFGFGTYIAETAKNLARGWKNLGKNNWLRKGLRGARNKIFGPKVTKTGVRKLPGNVTDAAFDIKPKTVSQFTRQKSGVGKLLQRSNIAAKKLRKLPIGRGAGGALSVLFAGMEFKGRKDEGQTTGKALLGTAGSTLGGMAGASKGAAIGAAIGSVIPGAGTAIGAVLGGLIGGVGGAMLGGKAADTVSDAVGLGGDTRLNKKVNKTGKLEESDKSAVIINNAIKNNDASKVTPFETPVGGSSLPMVSPDDASNPYVAKMAQELGIF